MGNPQNQKFWNDIAKRGENIQKDFWYGAEKLAKYLNDNPAKYMQYMTYDTSKPGSNLTTWQTILFYLGQSEYNQAVTYNNTSKATLEGGGWLWGALKGDFNKDPSISQIIVSGVISLIPVADQVSDVRDLIANLITLSEEKDRTTENYMALALTGVGIIPEIGSAIKTVVKVARGKGATKDLLIKSMEQIEAVFTFIKIKCPWNKAPETWLRSKPWQKIATQTFNTLKININRILAAVIVCIKKFNGALKNTLVKFQTALNHILGSIKNYIDQLCNETQKAIEKLLPQPKLATAQGTGLNPPTNRYDANVKLGQPTNATHQQKELPPKDPPPPKDKSLDDPCLLRPYKPDTCKPLGKTGHHVVPDRCFRLGSRSGDNRNPIKGAISEGEGLVICVEGATPTATNEHGRIHKQFSIYESALKATHSPEATAPLVEVEIAGAKSVSSVLKKCSSQKIAIQLRAYHQAKNLGATYRARVDVTGKIARGLPGSVFGSPTDNKDRGF